jgi:protoporphyrinogen oxidase
MDGVSHLRPGQHAIVIGAGPTGLGAAQRLVERGMDVDVIEADSIPGGLAGTLRVDGFGFDFGGHRLITRDERVVELASELLDDSLLQSTRVSRILFQRRFWSQPLEIGNAMRSVRPSVAARALGGYLRAETRRAAMRVGGRKLPPDRSFEDWVVSRFGRPLYEMFFEPYTRKVWGVDPATISAAWAPRRIMVAGLAALIKTLLLSEARRPPTAMRQYLYPRLGAGELFEKLAERCAGQGVKFHYDTRATSVSLGSGEVTVATDRAGTAGSLTADAVISTLPLPDLVRMVQPAPPAGVLAAADHLGYRGIVFVFLRLARSAVLNWDNLYVPEPDYIFFRVEEPLFWSQALVPPGRTSLCLEIAATPGDAVWEADDEQITARCVDDLNRIGFSVTSREILGVDVVRKHAVYPLQLVGTRERRKECLDYITSLAPRLQSVGRQGAFRYIDMDQAIAMGWDAADMVTGAGEVELADDSAQTGGYQWDPQRKVAGLRND